MITAPVAPPIVVGKTLMGTSVHKISGSISTDRNATVEIENYSKESLTDPLIYCYSGDVTIPLPTVVNSGTREVAAFSKSSAAGSGSIFVFSYALACGRRFAVLVYIPADQSNFDNLFGATFLEEDVETDYDLYSTMLYDSEYSSRRRSTQDGKPVEIRHEDYTITVTMSDAVKSMVKVTVFRDYDLQEEVTAYDWIPCRNGEHPENAVVGGWEEEGRKLLVVRSYIQGVLTPGKLHANIRSPITACIPFDGKEHYVDDYEVLTAADNTGFDWVPSKDGYRHPKAVVGGKGIDGHELLVGRVRFHGGMHPGNIQPLRGVCSIGFDKRELHFTEYEILTHH